MNAWRDSALGCQPAFPWLASRLHDEDKRPGNEGKWGFYHPFPSHTVAGPRSPDCLCVCTCVCVLLHWEVNQMCVPISWSLAYGRTLAQGCSLEKSLTLLETCGEMPKVWNIYTLPVCVYVCVCMQGSVFKRTFISSSDIITLPWGRGELSSSPFSFSNPSTSLLHPPSFTLTFSFLS